MVESEVNSLLNKIEQKQALIRRNYSSRDKFPKGRGQLRARVPRAEDLHESPLGRYHSVMEDDKKGRGAGWGELGRLSPDY